MNPFRVASKSDVEAHLDSQGYQATDNVTETGRFWVSKDGRHIQLPHPIQDMYPDFVLKDLEARIGKIPRRALH